MKLARALIGIALLALAAVAVTHWMAPPVRWRELQGKMAHASSLRAFYEEAMKRPQDGGYFYAMRALEICRMYTKADPAMSAQRREAIEQMHQRCDFSMHEQDDAGRKLWQMGEARLTEDPLYSRLLGFQMAATPESMIAALRAVIDVGDPNLIAAVAGLSIEVDVWKALGKFTGTVEDNVKYAKMLTACRLGDACGPDSLAAQSLCAVAGWCGAGIADAVTSPFDGDYALIDRLSQQVVADIRKGQLTRLLRRSSGMV